MSTQGRTAMQDAQQTTENNPASMQPDTTPGDKCQFCHGREFKRSRLHLADLPTLLRLRVPARCVRCGQLQTISLMTARTALPAGKRGGPTHEVVVPVPAPVLQTPVVQTAAVQAPVVQAAAVRTPVAAPVPAAARVSDSSDSRQTAPVQAELGALRDAIPYALLKDALDIRCQYCPGQAFRRSRLRIQDLALILMMRYSARCLRCGQRQTVSFMVAASGVPSSYRQAKSLRNTETWGQFTANSAPAAPRMGPVKPLEAVVEQVYTLKDIPVGTDTPLNSLVRDLIEPSRRGAAPKAKPAEAAPAAAKRPADDRSIW